MNKILAIFALFQISMASCSTKSDISQNDRFGSVLGHPIKTKVPLNLYEIDFQLDGYKDRYILGGQTMGWPMVGIVPTGHQIIFERATRRHGPTVSTEHLEGTLIYHGKTYLIAYNLGLSGQSVEDFWKGIRYDFDTK